MYFSSVHAPYPYPILYIITLFVVISCYHFATSKPAPTNAEPLLLLFYIFMFSGLLIIA